MTKKDYERIARALRSARRNQPATARNDLSDHNRGVEWSARALADELAHDNPRFDRARFLAACGVAP